MRTWQRIGAGLVVVAAVAVPAAGRAEERAGGVNLFPAVHNVQVVNRLRGEYDDNIFQTERDKQDSFKIIEELELSLNANFERTLLSLRYQPGLVWWSDRPSDDLDLHHAADLTLRHQVSPRLTLALQDTLRYAEVPEAIDRGSVIRENNDYLYNSAIATALVQLKPGTRLEASGRVITLAYDDDAVARTQDYDLYVGGLTVRHDLQPVTAVLGDVRYEVLRYDDDRRDSDTVYVGAGVEHAFHPRLMAQAQGGYQRRSFDDTVADAVDSPYADASLTYLPSPATRISVGAGFSQYETDVSPYANQERTRLFASAAHDFTARLSGFLTAGYTRGRYDGEQVPAGQTAPNGDEDLWQVAARVAYQVARAHSIEAGYQWTDLESEVRSPFSRNRVNLGWVMRY